MALPGGSVFVYFLQMGYSGMSSHDDLPRKRPDRQQQEPTFLSRLFRYMCCRNANNVVDHTIHVKNALAKYSAHSSTTDGYTSSREASDSGDDDLGRGFGAFNPSFNPSEHGSRGSAMMDPRERDLPVWRRSDRSNASDHSSRSNSFRIHEPGRPLSVISEETLETSRSGYTFDRSQSRIMVTRENSRTSTPRSTVSHNRHGPHEGGGSGQQGTRHQRATSSTTISTLPSPRTDLSGSFTNHDREKGSAHSTPLRSHSAGAGLTLRQNSGTNLSLDKRASPPTTDGKASSPSSGKKNAGRLQHPSISSESDDNLAAYNISRAGRDTLSHLIGVNLSPELDDDGISRALGPSPAENSLGADVTSATVASSSHLSSSPPALTSAVPTSAKVHSPTPSRGPGNGVTVPHLQLHPLTHGNARSDAVFSVDDLSVGISAVATASNPGVVR